MRGIFVDIENELIDIAHEVEMLARGTEIYINQEEKAEPALAWLLVQGLASGVEKVYTGCERVMSMIARGIDNAKIETEDGWHISLLKRMAHPFPEIRPAVIEQDTYRALDRLRAFRHRQRNVYGLGLDADIVLERALETTHVFGRFRDDLEAFLRRQPSG
ncbi:hypothetical protein [Aquabacter spiritensis]|uniref:HepT-like domain-containing protein n=1 Tax=Aquabacter spiritensis TaxID=933073 RepID=A0A4R3LY68_9HYPH|nr:hypothetical protein [Aquabacter spiritensis]TCT05634.1 hypothetical protein EDC64_104191 [Aquabacter spiritensis]